MTFNPALAAMLAEPWSNNACRGYVMYAMENCGFSPESLPDVSGMTFDNALSRKERITRFLQIVKNPYCFCIGGVGVQIEFSENGPSLQDTLTDYLIRQKSGL